MRHLCAANINHGAARISAFHSIGLSHQRVAVHNITVTVSGALKNVLDVDLSSCGGEPAQDRRPNRPGRRHQVGLRVSRTSQDLSRGWMPECSGSIDDGGAGQIRSVYRPRNDWNNLGGHPDPIPLRPTATPDRTLVLAALRCEGPRFYGHEVHARHEKEPTNLLAGAKV